MDALILVDLQNDFTPATEQKPAGSLAVSDGNAVVPIANQLSELFNLVIATQDWHPADHLSFASQHPGKQPFETIDLDGLEQVLWPDHCVQGTEGADLLSGLNTERIDHVVRKGTDRSIDSYSGFYDNDHRKATGLDAYVKSKNVDRVIVMGLALDVCVKFTTLDALKLGFETWVIRDGCRAVEMRAGDGERAFTTMRDAGAHLIDSREVAEMMR